MVLLFTAFVMSFLISCSTISSGKKYTLAKVNRDKQLIEPHRLLKDSNLDLLDEVNPTDVLSIVMHSGYLPYLHEVGRPEVAIFVSAKIRAKDKPLEELLWERVYLNSEADGSFLVVNKDSFLPRKDITLLPAIIYDGQEILISIRIIEMDQADNERMKSLVAVAAAAASTFQPEAAGAISVFQNILNFIIENNADDIEFQYDFTLAESLGPFHYYKGKQKFDMVLNPRINTYALIKTEHRERPIIPYGYADSAQNGLRYGVAEILKFGTLGILNWSMWCDYVFPCKHMDIKDQDDLYHAILGRPFAPVRDSFVPPIYNEKRLLTTTGDIPGIFEIVGNNIKVKNNEQLFDYEDQAYLIFSVLPDTQGVDITTLQKIAKEKKFIENLQLNTTQLSPADFKKHLDPILKAVEGFVAERNIREQCTARINKAETPEAIEVVRKECEKLVAEVPNPKPKSRTVELAMENTTRDINSLAERRLEFLQNLPQQN